jgi:Helix-turn-helix domain
VSVKAMSWAWDQEVGGNDKLVLLRLADHANDDGVCWPSQDTMHVKCGIGGRTVRACLAKLEAYGLISRTPRWRDGRRTTDLIKLLLVADPAGSQEADSATSKAAIPAGSKPAKSAGSQAANNDRNNRQNLPGNPKEEPPTTEPLEQATSSLTQGKRPVKLKAVKVEDQVAALFAYWQERCGHSKALLDSKRRTKAKARLREGRTIEECRQAIDGAAVGAWVNPDTRVRYDGFATIFQDAEKFELMMKRAEAQAPAPVRDAFSDATRRRQEREDAVEQRVIAEREPA